MFRSGRGDHLRFVIMNKFVHSLIANVVVAVTDATSVLLLSPEELEACNGSIDLLVAAIRHAADRLNLFWPTN